MNITEPNGVVRKSRQGINIHGMCRERPDASKNAG